MKTILTCLFAFAFAGLIHAQDIVWDPAGSTYDGKAFVQLQPGVGVLSLGFPSTSNPAGAGTTASGVYAFGFATAIPGSTGPTMAQTELKGSALTAGTNLVLRFSKPESESISFIAMVADASDPTNIGFKQLSATQIEIRAKIVDPILSENKNPDIMDSAFGLIMQTTATPNSAFNFRGTVFVTDMHWLDLDPPGLEDLPQTQSAEEVSGMVAGLVAKGIFGNRANFNAYMPEDFFVFARDNGVEVNGANCLGYRTYVELTGSDEGFFKLNTPTDLPYDDPNFDIDDNGQSDAIWRYRISNTTWSRQVLTFGKVSDNSAGVTAPSPDFDRDGDVDFGDFILLAQSFGEAVGASAFDERCDLNTDGIIDFQNFLPFAQAFGKPVSSAKIKGG
jgi:hypothetical protein